MTAFFPPSALLAQVPGRIAVLPFESHTRYVNGAVASNLFDSFVIKHSSVTVVERAQLDRILGEQYLELRSGNIDPDSAARLHSILGVEGLVFGSVLALDHEVSGGAGTIMIHARLVDTTSGRILWADTVTSRVRESFKRKVSRFFSGAAPDSDSVVTGLLIEEGTKSLARRLTDSSSLGATAPVTKALVTSKIDSRPAMVTECTGAERKISRLGESVLSEEALYWALKLKSKHGVTENPGGSYTDKELRRRLNTKILFWMDERDLPQLSPRQLERLADAKEQMRRLLTECGPHPLIASGRMQ